MKTTFSKAIALATFVLSPIPFVSCSSSSDKPDGGARADGSTADGGAAGVDASTGGGADSPNHPMPEAAPTVAPDAMPPTGSFCSLPGSVVFSDAGAAVMPGGDPSWPNLSSWLKLPSGFCAHYFASHHTIRQLRFAPDGDLFAAAPYAGTTGGRGDPTQSIYVLPDDNHDGVADSTTVFLNNMPNTQGLMFTGGYFYYQDHTTIRRVAFHAGDRTPSGPSELVVDVGQYFRQDGGHWPKVMDVAQDGTIFITNGGSQGDSCVSTRPVLGSVHKLNADNSLTPVAVGLRNPIAIRCEPTHNVCIAAELAKDYSYTPDYGREKLVPIVVGAPVTDWGFPCCATKNQAYAGISYADSNQAPDCSGVASEEVGFFIGHTPFGLDFESSGGKWPAPWGSRVFVTLHGIVGSFLGARIVAIPLDPMSGIPLPATELDAATTDPNSDGMLDFATGWGNNDQSHGRPAAVTFAPDGRMFVGDDYGDSTGSGSIVWIAPVSMMMP
ncbi:MAG TPA: hypothetical protein VKU41_18400 [Polyangiaceae bacterium]|nr:hypothetical protein [Polyangiaceae bacterium]